jgi:ribosomal protein S18 acetylase RimI-like enzyme
MSLHEILLRLADIRDAALIADLSRKTFHESFAPYNTKEDMDIFLKDQFTRQSLIAEVGVSFNSFYLAYVDEKIAGYIKLRERNHPKELTGLKALEIARIYATQAMVGRGVGSKMMLHTFEVARQKQKEVIWLAVWEKNQRAIEFYSKWGYEIFGKQIFVLGTDLQNDWLMKKVL